MHGQLWHAVTLLREYRGDGHTVALVANGLSGLEALITHTVTGIGFSVPFVQGLRGWSEEQWADGVARLRARGLIDGAGALTDAGVQLRTRVEDLTDELACAPGPRCPMTTYSLRECSARDMAQRARENPRPFAPPADGHDRR